MPVTSFHKPTGKYLTSFGKDAKAGDTPCISRVSYSKVKCYGWAKPSDDQGTPQYCEFTFYLLGEPIALDERWGEPLFDLAETPWACAIDVDGRPTPERIREVWAMPALERYPLHAA